MDSLTSSLAHQVPMDPSTAAATPVNRLPNELVYAFLVKLEMPELIRIRLVSPRWKAVIESIGKTKKSLIVSFGYDFRFEPIFQKITRRFLGQIKLKRDFVFIKLKRKSYYPKDIFRSLLVALFPNVEQLVIMSPHLNYIITVLMLSWPVPQITTLSLSVINTLKSLTALQVAHFDNWINSMASLKRLDLQGGFEPHLVAISPNIYANLEHFSHHTFGEFNEPVAKQVLGNLGPNCTRLSLTSSGLEPTNVLDWLNPDLIGRLTHLAVPFSPDFEWELEEACDKFTSLQTLYIRTQWFDSVELTPRLFNVLSRLSKLSELQLDADISAALFPKPNLTPLVNVRVFVLHLHRRYPQIFPNRDQLTQYFVTNFLPNIQQLTIEEH